MKNDLLRAGVTPETYDITADPARAQEFRSLGGRGTPLTWVETGPDAAGNPAGSTFSGRSEDAVKLARTPLPDAPATAGSVPAPPPHSAQQLLEREIPPPRTQQQAAQELVSGTLRQSPTFQSFLQSLVQKAAGALAQLTRALGTVPGEGQTSRYRKPDPTYRGYGRPGGYQPLQRRGDPALLHKKEFSKEPNPQPQDTSRLGTPGGGKPGDPFWAIDCACVSSTGKAPGVAYDAPFGDRCPGNPLLPCEACRPITHHDNLVSKTAECLRHSDPPHHPISF